MCGEGSQERHPAQFRNSNLLTVDRKGIQRGRRRTREIERNVSTRSARSKDRR
jgi:hypothetical protein